MPTVQDNIAELLLVFRNYLRRELQPFGGIHGRVELANIADYDKNKVRSNGVEATLGNSIVLTLVRAEEDPTRRNQRNYRTNPADDSLFYRNPPVGLNLYVLVTAAHDDYVVALRILSRVAAVLQRRSWVPSTDPAWEDVPGHYEEQRLKYSLVAQTFEQQNHLWAMLGGRQLPSLLYLVQTASLEYIPDSDPTGPPVTTIELTETIR